MKSFYSRMGFFVVHEAKPMSFIIDVILNFIIERGEAQLLQLEPDPRQALFSVLMDNVLL